MNRLNRVALFAVFLVSSMAGLAQEKKPPSEYATLLARVKGGDLTIDFQKLRFSYMESPERHEAKDTSSQKSGMFKDLKAKDYKKVIKDADAVLASEYVDMDAHFVEYIAYREMNESEKSDFHKAVFSGLLKSITDSGDGTSTKTAYVVISVHEEYVVLQIRGLVPSGQSVLNEDGHSYDRLDARDPKTNATETLYFNVDIPFKHYLN